MTGITNKQRHILRHALGMAQGLRAYRNHFVTGEGSDDYADCCALVEAGLMDNLGASDLSGGGDAFRRYLKEAADLEEWV